MKRPAFSQKQCVPLSFLASTGCNRLLPDAPRSRGCTGKRQRWLRKAGSSGVAHNIGAVSPCYGWVTLWKEVCVDSEHDSLPVSSSVPGYRGQRAPPQELGAGPSWSPPSLAKRSWDSSLKNIWWILCSRYQPLALPHSRPTSFHPFIHPRSSPSPVSSTSSSDYFEANHKHHIFFNCNYINIKLQRKITLLKNITTILCPTYFTWTSVVAQW